jgi:4-amino-4-deoxy-L-arabinose transferase-like glycosyltransferase
MNIGLKIKEFMAKIHTPVWLTVLLGIVLLLRIPSFFEPFSYGDEMIYLTLGEGIRQGATLYKEVYDNKPPLLYLLAAVAGNVFWFKAILAFWNVATIILFWKLSSALFPNKEKLQKASTVIFALLTTLPLFEGNIVNSEIFMIGPIIAAFLILFTKKLNFKNIFLSGTLFGLATLFKVPAAFDMPVIIVYWLVTAGLKKDDLRITLKRSFYLSLGFLAPIGLSLVWFFFAGALGDYVRAAFLQNIGYLSSWRPSAASTHFIERNLPLLIRASVVLLGAVILFLKRKDLSHKFIFLTLWLLFGLFAVALSERPYPHYLIQVVPAVSFLIAILLTEKTVEQSLTIIPLFLAILVPVYYKFWYNSTNAYYLRFLRFSVGQVSKEGYLASFGQRVPTHYKIVDFITSSSRPNEKIFVWGPDSSAVYALSRRLPPTKYVADYHINDFSTKKLEVEKLTQNPPKFIIILPDAKGFTELTPLLRKSYMLISEIDGAEIWRLSGSFK